MSPEAAFSALCVEADSLCEAAFRRTLSNFSLDTEMILARVSGFRVLAVRPSLVGWDVLSRPVEDGIRHRPAWVSVSEDCMSEREARGLGWEIMDQILARSTSTMTEDFGFELGMELSVRHPSDPPVAKLLMSCLFPDLYRDPGLVGSALEIGSAYWLRSRALRPAGMTGQAGRLAGEAAGIADLVAPAEASAVRREATLIKCRASLLGALRMGVNNLPDGEIEAVLRDVKVASVLES